MTNTIPRRRMRSAGIALGVTAVVASGLSGCASEPDYAAVCVDPQTQQRVDDDDCDNADRDYNGSGSGFFWYYLGASSRVPAVGSGVSGGTFNGSALTKSGTKVQRGGLTKSGGSSVKSTTTKGGFGSSTSSGRGISS